MTPPRVHICEDGWSGITHPRMSVGRRASVARRNLGCFCESLSPHLRCTKRLPSGQTSPGWTPARTEHTGPLQTGFGTTKEYIWSLNLGLIYWSVHLWVENNSPSVSRQQPCWILPEPADLSCFLSATVRKSRDAGVTPQGPNLLDGTWMGRCSLFLFFFSNRVWFYVCTQHMLQYTLK